MKIILDDLRHPEVHALLEEHLAHMHSQSPPESVHALDLDKLRRPEISFWSVWNDDGQLMGSGALKTLNDGHGEVKSMRTREAFRGQGVGAAVLAHIVDEARRRGLQRLSLETGSQPGFAAAVRLYLRFGFEACGPFEGYTDDPNSLFMTRLL